MKFFTPDLYNAFNSDDSDVALEAAERWEQAIKDYKGHLREIRGRLSPGARALAEKTCLHDAELRLFQTGTLNGKRDGMALLLLARTEGPLLLVYHLAKRPSSSRPLTRRPFTKTRDHVLYDEIDAPAEGRFEHEILWSDGSILKLTFVECSAFNLDTDALQSALPAGAAN